MTIRPAAEWPQTCINIAKYNIYQHIVYLHGLVEPFSKVGRSVFNALHWKTAQMEHDYELKLHIPPYSTKINTFLILLVIHLIKYRISILSCWHCFINFNMSERRCVTEAKSQEWPVHEGTGFACSVIFAYVKHLCILFKTYDSV